MVIEVTRFISNSEIGEQEAIGFKQHAHNQEYRAPLYLSSAAGTGNTFLFDWAYPLDGGY